VNAGGSPTKDGSGNGNPPERYEVWDTDGYRTCRDEIKSNYPRVAEEKIFELVAFMVRLFPPDLYAENVRGKGWQLVTQEGFCVPEIYIFFRFENGQITLELAAPDD
jgi:hypothetical protein